MTECTIAQEQCGGKCTDYDGSKIWKKLHALPKEIECETCAEEGKNLFEFAHDIKNAQLGKPIFNKKNFKKLANQVKCICDKTGACK